MSFRPSRRRFNAPAELSDGIKPVKGRKGAFSFDREFFRGLQDEASDWSGTEVIW